MASKGSCKKAWLCATQDKSELCYRYYHTCWMATGHVGPCESASGLGHDSDHRVGDIVASVPDAYRQMSVLGWGDDHGMDR